MGSDALELLLACAQAIQDENLKLADSLLEQIWILVAEESDEQQRKVVKYFAEALVRRAYGLHPTVPYNSQWLPYGFTHIIGEAINTVVTKKKRLHLIDFDIPKLYGWGYLFGELANRFSDPLSVRVTVILPPYLEKTVKIQEEKQRLITWAKESEIDLDEDLKVIYANNLGEVDESILDSRRAADEAVVVYYIFKLHTLLAETGAMEKEMLKLRQINPDIVIIKEQAANNNDSNFIKRLENSFLYYSQAFCFDGYSYQQIENYYRQQIRNIVGSEGKDRIVRHETLNQWRSRLLSYGFFTVPLEAKPMLCTIYASKIHEENGCLVLSQENYPLFFISAWTLPDWEDHFNMNSFCFHPVIGFNPKPTFDDIVQPLRLLPDGACFSLNRLAAFVEIYDMLEDACSKYELPLALMWASRVNVKSKSYKKYIPYIESSYSYVNGWKSQQFTETLAKQKHFLEGQAIVRKAFQSNRSFLFEPSIDLSKRCDYQFSSAADEFGPHAALVISMQTHYDDVYVVQFFLPEKLGNSESLALHIFNEVNNMKKMFVRLRVHGNEVGFQEDTISNFGRMTSSLNAAVPSEQGTLIQSLNPVDTTGISFSSLDGIGPLNAPNMCNDGVMETQGPYEQAISNVVGHGINANANETHAVPRTKQRKLSSKVWNDFDKFEVNGKQVAKCRHCHKEFPGSSKSGTTHLKNHLERCPRKKKENRGSRLTFPDTTARNPLFDQERSRLDLARMIVKHQYPLDMAEQELFRTFVKNLQPMFEFQSQEVILSDIHHIYEEEKAKLLGYFKDLACNFCLTISLHRDSLGKNAYSCLIAHFIDDGWELKMKILAFKKLEHIDHIGTLSGIIQSSLSDWNLSKKVCSMTLDNSSLSDDIAQQIKENCLSGQGLFPSCHCFIGCSLIQDGMHEIADILLKIRNSVEYVSENADGKLNRVKLQDRKSLDDLPNLRLDSDFGILESALQSREIFCLLESGDGNFKVNLSMDEWDKALALHSCLKGFYDILSTLDGTQPITANMYFPKLCDIYKKFLQLEKRNYPFITVMKRKFDNYWSSCNLVFAIAAVLDPRLKFTFVEFSYKEIYDHDGKIQLNRFHKILTDVYYEYANEPENLTKSASIFGDSGFLTRQTALNTANSDSSILDSFGKYASSSSFNGVTSWKSELECYLEEPLLPLDNGTLFDILSWWRVNSERFPTLGKMARDLLAMPALVVPPCSNLGTVITNPSYKSMSPDSMEALVCTQNWLQMPKTNDNANHAPMQSMAKRKMEEKEIHGVKTWKSWNYEETSGSGDKSQASCKVNVQQERTPLKSSERNHGREISGLIKLTNGDPSSNNQSELQCSSHESNGDLAWRLDQGAWHEKDVRAYLVSSFTEKEHTRLKRWQSHEMSGKLIGRYKEFRLVDHKLVPLLHVPHGYETRVDYYIDDSVINTFFKLLKKRSDRFPKAYINHYSFDSGIATYLIEGSRSEHEVLAWFKDEKLIHVHKMFLPLCLSAHWILFYIDTKKQTFSWLDSNISSRLLNDVEKQIILRWFREFLLPAFGYNNANDWPFELCTDIPLQNNLVDCGLFVMKYADCLTHGDFFPFTQQDMGHFRHRTFLDIYHGRLRNQK